MCQRSPLLQVVASLVLMFTTLKFATDTNIPKGFHCSVSLCVMHIKECLCFKYLYSTLQVCLFLCVSVDVSIHQRETPPRPPKPVETICSSKLLTAGLSVGRGKYGGEFFF